ncbi:hypothetical protein P170DRAFT_433488 [Aspergillus steynii IBT 23096]|uniref:Uncharacterized protein n=1 Tax=Aspergillus steynii IBT 23096 TaxID=1392250 RepID=A0A2I2GFA1_9EURO|nr:uncharacterized protein P170DRAFT_433488 [Aspergillus steynii IBT 23096]PLB51556.1 hypothetical protein P170DRAFT_433488 [Aspergillus steynii IBT 23096]
MPSSDRARRALLALWDSVIQTKTNWDIGKITASDLSQIKVKWDTFPLDHKPGSYMCASPPVLFCPLPQTVLDTHPVKEEPGFIEYAPSTRGQGPAGLPWSPLNCATNVERYLSGWLSHFSRVGFPKPPREGETMTRLSLVCDVGWEQITFPDPLLLKNGLGGKIIGQQRLYEGFAWQWPEEENGLPKFPHIVASVRLNCDVHEDTITLVELTFLINVMKSRASQPDISEQEAELWHEGVFREKDMQNRPPVFPRETRFPILVVSLVGPQHGRMLYACMDKGVMSIRQSRLYSFEKKDTEILDLFTRWLLSTPIAEGDG